MIARLQDIVIEAAPSFAVNRVLKLGRHLGSASKSAAAGVQLPGRRRVAAGRRALCRATQGARSGCCALLADYRRVRADRGRVLPAVGSRLWTTLAPAAAARGGGTEDHKKGLTRVRTAYMWAGAALQEVDRRHA